MPHSWAKVPASASDCFQSKVFWKVIWNKKTFGTLLTTLEDPLCALTIYWTTKESTRSSTSAAGYLSSKMKGTLGNKQKLETFYSLMSEGGSSDLDYDALLWFLILETNSFWLHTSSLITTFYSFRTSPTSPTNISNDDLNCPVAQNKGPCALTYFTAWRPVQSYSHHAYSASIALFLKIPQQNNYFTVHLGSGLPLFRIYDHQTGPQPPTFPRMEHHRLSTRPWKHVSALGAFHSLWS